MAALPTPTPLQLSGSAGVGGGRRLLMWLAVYWGRRAHQSTGTAHAGVSRQPPADLLAKSPWLCFQLPPTHPPTDTRPPAAAVLSEPAQEVEDAHPLLLRAARRIAERYFLHPAVVQRMREVG